MKNFIMALIVMLTVCGSSFGECINGICNVPRKTVTVTKNVVRETVRLPRKVLSNCTNGRCSSRTTTRVR